MIQIGCVIDVLVSVCVYAPVTDCHAVLIVIVIENMTDPNGMMPNDCCADAHRASHVLAIDDAYLVFDGVLLAIENVSLVVNSIRMI